MIENALEKALMNS